MRSWVESAARIDIEFRVVRHDQAGSRVLRSRSVWEDVVPVDPPSQVDPLAAFGAKRKRRQVFQRGDLVGSGTDWAATADHDSLLEPDEVVLAGCVLEGLVELGDLLSLADFGAPFAEFSA
jgi:hypothetical protein